MLVAVPARAFTLLDPNTWPPVINPHNWPFDLFPVPEVATNPNGGITYGVLLAFLFKDSQNQIQSILAPDVNNDTKLGFGGTVRYFAYPSPICNGMRWREPRKKSRGRPISIMQPAAPTS